MTPENIKRRRARRKREAVWGVVFFVLLQLVCAVCLGALCWIPEMPKWLAVLFCALAVLCLALIVPAILSLKQRIEEIEGGELDAADQY